MCSVSGRTQVKRVTGHGVLLGGIVGVACSLGGFLQASFPSPYKTLRGKAQFRYVPPAPATWLQFSACLVAAGPLCLP